VCGTAEFLVDLIDGEVAQLKSKNRLSEAGRTLLKPEGGAVLVLERVLGHAWAARYAIRTGNKAAFCSYRRHSSGRPFSIRTEHSLLRLEHVLPRSHAHLDQHQGANVFG